MEKEKKRHHRFEVTGNTKRSRIEGEDPRFQWRVFNGRAEAFWKGRMVTSKPVEAGDRICITVQGVKTKVEVEMPPQEQVAREAWMYGFYRNKRFSSFEKLALKAGNLRRKDKIMGRNVPAGKIFVNPEKTVAVAYRILGENQPGRPYGWYASPDASPEEVTRIIEKAYETMFYGENGAEEYIAVGKVSCLRV